MDNVVSATSATKDPGFFKHIFNDNYKNELFNLLQYGLIGIVPMAVIIRNVNFFFPALDKTKGSIELLLEALGQLCITFILITFVHRIITYFTPWGGTDMGNLNLPSMIMIFLWMILSFDLGHVGKKLNYIYEKLMPLPKKNFWSEAKPARVGKRGSSVVRVSQPLSRLPPAVPTHQVSQTDYITAQNQMTPPLLPQSGSQTALPVNTMSTALSTGTETQQYGSMSQYNQSLDNAAMQQSQQQMYSESSGHGGGAFREGMEPIAANSVLGAGFSSF